MVFQSIPHDPASPMEEETEHIIDGLASSYQEIGARWPKERRYSRIFSAAIIAVLLGLGYLILFSSSAYKFPVFFYVIIWIAVPLTIASIFRRKLDKIELDPEEKIFIDVYELASELRQYPLPIDMSGVASDLDYIIEELELNWTLGFRLAKEALSSVTEFMNNLRFRLLQALLKGKTEDVKLSVWTLAKLCQLLIDEHPKVSQLEDINNGISKLPKWEEVQKIRFHVKLRLWMANHSTARWVGIACLCAMIGIGIIALGNALGYASQAFSTGVGGSIALFAAFLLSPRLKKQ